MEMMRNLRHVNIDHLHVGWYQSTQYGTFLNKALLDSQFNYQHSIEESVVLIYDPLKTSKSTLSLKAYRLTQSAMESYKDYDFTTEALKKTGLCYENVFEEIPIVIHNSYLINTLLCELKEISPPTGDNFLSLSSGNMLEKNLELLMDYVDDLAQETNKYMNYQRAMTKLQQNKQQYTYKRTQENSARQARGDPPLPDEDLTKLFKSPQPPLRLESMLMAGQMKNYCTEINKMGASSFGKLFMADALQKDNPAS